MATSALLDGVPAAIEADSGRPIAIRYHRRGRGQRGVARRRAADVRIERKVEMTLRTKFVRIAATAGAGAAVGMAVLVLTASASSQSGAVRRNGDSRHAAAAAAKSSACHITQPHSLAGPPANIRFVNHHHGAVGVYWLNYQGYLVYYETIARNHSVLQKTYRSSAWVMLNSSFSCVGYVVVAHQPKYFIH
jgi:hypothetical protein